MPRAKASLELDGTMSHRQIRDALAAMVFTAARGWARTVRMDEDVRDFLVNVLSLSIGANKDQPTTEVLDEHRHPEGRPPEFREMRGILKRT